MEKDSGYDNLKHVQQPYFTGHYEMVGVFEMPGSYF